MADDDRPQIYLITPPDFSLDVFPDQLAQILDAVRIACIRLTLAGTDEDKIGRACDALRQVAHDSDVALVIENHIRLVERHGIDGVHLTDGARSIRFARKELGTDAIVGTFCGNSRHEGLSAGEAGADYVAFGPIGATTLGRGDPADIDLFSWWSEVIEVPVVAEGNLTPDLVESFAPITDFLGVGAEIWSAEDPVRALQALMAPLG